MNKSGGDLMKGTGYMSNPEDIAKIKADIAELMQSKNKTQAVSEVAKKYICSTATIWERLREGMK